jgi:GxxExxY protein
MNRTSRLGTIASGSRCLIKKREVLVMGHEFEAASKRILEAAVAVHRALGPGFLEGVYQKALEVALRHRNIPFEKQREIQIVFEDMEVGLHRVDLIAAGEIIVELKAVKALEDIHYAQLKSYLKASCLRVGLLLNFNAPTLAVKRIVL